MSQNQPNDLKDEKKELPEEDWRRPDPKAGKRVIFAGADHGSLLNDSPEAWAARSDVPKTSEYAFFKKLKSDASVRHGSKLSNKVENNTKLFDSGIKTRDFTVKDRHINPSFETARHGFHGLYASPVNVTPKGSEEGLKQSSAAVGIMCNRDENMKSLVNNTGPGGVNDQQGDIFSIKRQKLRQWVRDTSFPDIYELTSSGHDLVSVLLARLFPGTEEKEASKILKEEWLDGPAEAKLLETPHSGFLNGFEGAVSGLEHGLRMENNRPIYWVSSPSERIIPSLPLPSCHVLSSFMPRDTEETGLESWGKTAISYAKGDLASSPPLLKYREILSDEEYEDCYSQAKSSYPISSPQFKNYEPLSLSYLKERVQYGSQGSFLERKEPALLLEWDSVSKRCTDGLSPGYNTKFITYPFLPSSSGNDYPWSSNDTSRNSDITELYPEHGLRRHIIQDIVPVSDLNQHTWYHMNSIDDRDSDYISTHKDSSVFYHHLPSSLLFDKQSWKCLHLSGSAGENHSSTYETTEASQDGETMSLSPFSTSNANLLEAPVPVRTHHVDSLDWPTFCVWSPQSWTGSWKK